MTIVSTWRCVGTVNGHAPGPGCGEGGTGDARTVDLAAAKHVRESKHATMTSHRVEERK